jgi:hypothetical protein
MQQELQRIATPQVVVPPPPKRRRVPVRDKAGNITEVREEDIN